MTLRGTSSSPSFLAPLHFLPGLIFLIDKYPALALSLLLGNAQSAPMRSSPYFKRSPMGEAPIYYPLVVNAWRMLLVQFSRGVTSERTVGMANIATRVKKYNTVCRDQRQRANKQNLGDR